MNDPLQDTADFLGLQIKRINALVSSPSDERIDTYSDDAQYYIDQKHPDEANWIQDINERIEESSPNQ